MAAEQKNYITVFESSGGWKAVHVWWNDDPDIGGFWEPYQTGFGLYKTRDEAVLEAKSWAEEEEIDFRTGST